MECVPGESQKMLNCRDRRCERRLWYTLDEVEKVQKQVYKQKVTGGINLYVEDDCLRNNKNRMK